MSTVPMTVAGEAALREELQRLKSVERPRIIQAIAEARAHGEGRIQEIEGKLAEARIIDITTIPRTGKVIFGVTVDLINTDTEAAVTYKIVGEDEADVKQNRISVTSPIARALIGKEVGDVVVVKTPGGDVEYEIEDVRHE